MYLIWHSVTSLHFQIQTNVFEMCDLGDEDIGNQRKESLLKNFLKTVWKDYFCAVRNSLDQVNQNYIKIPKTMQIFFNMGGTGNIKNLVKEKTSK